MTTCVARFGFDSREGGAVSPEQNKALVRRFYQEIDKGNIAAMDELVADDYIENGKLAEHWSAVDSAALVSQLGVIQLPIAKR